MPQLTNAAMYQGLFSRFLRCAYQAKVMKMLEQTSSPAVLKMTDLKMVAMPRAVREKRASAFRCLFGVFSPGCIIQ